MFPKGEGICEGEGIGDCAKHATDRMMIIEAESQEGGINFKVICCTDCREVS